MDVQFRNEGTIWLAFLKTDAASDWVEEHVSAPVYYGPRCLVIGHRYVGDVAQGMADDGLQIEEV